MQVTETIRLYLSPAQRAAVLASMQEYIRTVNWIVSQAVADSVIDESGCLIVAGRDISMKGMTSKDIDARLSSPMRNQALNDARSILKKYQKAVRKVNWCIKKAKKKEDLARIKPATLPVLKRPVCTFVNTALKIEGQYLSLPFYSDEQTKRNYSRRMLLKTRMTEDQISRLTGTKLGTARLCMKGDRIVAQVVYERPEAPPIPEGKCMGIDLGIKCPAVAYTSEGKARFFGNGRKIKYIRRHYAIIRKVSGQRKHRDVIKRINTKEGRVVTDINHKISRQIIDFAASEGIGLIKMETLKGIRDSINQERKSKGIRRGRGTRKSLKNVACDVNRWAFYQLATFIGYKAKLAGIAVETVNPAYTSQICPACGARHHAADRRYSCPDCGFRMHRDLVGAVNICRSTEYAGGDKETKVSGSARHTCAGDYTSCPARGEATP